MRALIAEDDATSRLLMKMLLTPYGETREAEDGAQAVEAFREALDEDRPFDLVCLDVMMPELDGHEALTAIRKAEEERGILLGCGVRVLMTTALGDSDNVMKGYRGRCDAYLVKPIDRDKLVGHLEAFGLT